jgi:hypothetical protein
MSASPLLIIAGAGSGKTNTLTHRVAHLIVKGADPRRIRLMTFSRRAAPRASPQGDGQRRGHDGRDHLGRHLPRASVRACCANMPTGAEHRINAGLSTRRLAFVLE